ncbi:MAG: exodeoxyribonuclease III [Synergistaceae bacterium]|jgi:exodeoxyribonuclease-3|nr:exodeoxyribonuclease III [Synergistaceae bacterium]
MRIATFNVNSLKARLPIVERFLSGAGAPDILCLQETKCQDAYFPVDFFEGLGYRCVYSGMKSYNGVAVVSRATPDRVSRGFGDGMDTESDRARLIIADFGDLSVACSYVPQGKSMDSPDFQYKLRFFDRLRSLFEARFKPSGKLLWTGDINVAREDIDVTHPNNKRDHVCFCQEAKDALERVISWGFVDVFRHHRPNPGEFSFWDYRVKDAFERNIGWRIDHLLATRPLSDASEDAYAVRDLRALERPSDHTAVVGVFGL